MKKYLTLLALVIFITPSVTFAIWWNPSTWFSRIDEMDFDYNNKMNREKQQKKNSDIIPNQTPTSISTPIPEIKTTFYVKYENTRLRKCASTDCEILGYYKVNDQIISTDSKPLTLKDMPEWIMFSLPDGETAYINKSVLSEKPVKVTKNAITDADKSIINKWISDMNSEITVSSTVTNYIKSKGDSGMAIDVLDVEDVYVKNIDVIKKQLVTASVNNQIDTVISLIDRYKNLKSNHSFDYEKAVITSRQRLDDNISNARIQATKDYYQNQQIQRDAVNKARIDAANAYSQKYNELLNNAKTEGVTEQVFNAQLNAAGMGGGQINCTTMPAAGMYGSYHITCY